MAGMAVYKTGWDDEWGTIEEYAKRLAEKGLPLTINENRAHAPGDVLVICGHRLIIVRQITLREHEENLRQTEDYPHEREGYWLPRDRFYEVRSD